MKLILTIEYMISTEIQQAVAAVGYNGRYQKILVVFLAILWFEITYMLLGCPFLFMNPVFICESEPDPVS